MKRIGLAVLAIFIASQNCLAGGVALSATRVIYDGSKKEVSLTVQNRSEKEEYLIQSWVDDINGSKQTPFIITPPLFKLNAKKNNVLRIVNIKDTLPQDRESVFWINVKSIPEKSDENAGKSVLQIAVRTRLKLFYRPVGLKGNSIDAVKQLRFQQQNNQIIVTNDSLFNLTFNKFTVGGKEIEKAGMVLAKGKININLPANIGKVSEVKYNIINDFGTSGDILTQRVE